jgi:hypothetical protein
MEDQNGDETMPIYFFNLKTNNKDIRDPEGAELADEAAAWELAEQVARDLMKRREPQTRSWRIDVRDSEGRQCFELLFASIDESIMAFGPELRQNIKNLHHKQASLTDAIAAVHLSLRQIQVTIARLKGKPFLASLDGVTIAAADEPPTRSGSRGATLMTDRDRRVTSNENRHFT